MTSWLATSGVGDLAVLLAVGAALGGLLVWATRQRPEPEPLRSLDDLEA